MFEQADLFYFLLKVFFLNIFQVSSPFPCCLSSPKLYFSIRFSWITEVYPVSTVI